MFQTFPYCSVYISENAVTCVVTRDNVALDGTGISKVREGKINLKMLQGKAYISEEKNQTDKPAQIEE